jgi:hypothetical protein
MAEIHVMDERELQKSKIISYDAHHFLNDKKWLKEIN